MTKKDMTLLLDLKKDGKRIITSADKGKAITLESHESYGKKNTSFKDSRSYYNKLRQWIVLKLQNLGKHCYGICIESCYRL